MTAGSSPFAQQNHEKPETSAGSNLGFALVTGASSGIGEVFARRLAARGYDLALVARREALLQALAEELKSQYRIRAIPLVADLSQPAGIESVEDWIKDCPDLAVLINDAGFGVVGSFANVNRDDHLGMIAVHVLATVRLCHAALPGMLARRKGAIVNVSSTSAFIPLGGNATYGATKAYLNAFTETLANELKGSGIKVQALCPGFTYTGFHDTPPFEGTNFRSHIPKFLWMDAGKVVDFSLNALERGKVIYIPGFKNQLIVLASRLGLVKLAGGLIRRRVKV